MHWFPKYNKSMDTFRADVKSGLVSAAEVETTALKKYYRVQLGAFSEKYCSGKYQNNTGNQPSLLYKDFEKGD